MHWACLVVLWNFLVESNFQTDTLERAHLDITLNPNTALSLNKSIKKYIHYYSALKMT